MPYEVDELSNSVLSSDGLLQKGTSMNTAACACRQTTTWLSLQSLLYAPTLTSVTQRLDWSLAAATLQPSLEPWVTPLPPPPGGASAPSKFGVNNGVLCGGGDLTLHRSCIICTPLKRGLPGMKQVQGTTQTSCWLRVPNYAPFSSSALDVCPVQTSLI